MTLSLDETALRMAEKAAELAGMSLSAWTSAAVRREAVRLGAGTAWGDHLAETLAADTDDNAAERDHRAAG